MPEFLDEFINETLPELWDKIKDFWNESTTNEIIIAAAVLVCLILAIAVHRANRRDRKYTAQAVNRSDIQPVRQDMAANMDVQPAVQEQFVQVNEPEGNLQKPAQDSEHVTYGLQEEDTATEDTVYSEQFYENDTPSYSARDVASIVVAVEEILRTSGKTDSGEKNDGDSQNDFERSDQMANDTDLPRTAQADYTHPIKMEKIELKREEHHPSVMTYNTSRKGMMFTEEELKKIIKD